MIAALATAVIVIAVVLAGWTALLAVLNRRGGRGALGMLAGVEAVVLIQFVAAIVLLSTGERPAGNTVEFLGYHLAAVLVLPAGVIWSLADESRWSAGVLTVACLSVAVMTVRMNQLWSGAGG